MLLNKVVIFCRKAGWSLAYFKCVAWSYFIASILQNLHPVLLSLPKTNSDIVVLTDFDIEIKAFKSQCIASIKKSVPHLNRDISYNIKLLF
jgi:hypothetical protein